MFASVVTTLEAIAVPAVKPSNNSNSASARTALPAVNAVPVITPPEVIVPLTSKFAFTSTSVAFNSISSVALISKIAFVGAPIFCEASLN